MGPYERFLQETGDHPLYPPVPNFSPFFVGSGFNSEKYFGPWYETVKGSPLLMVADREMRFGWLEEANFTQTSREIFQKSVHDLSESNARLARFEIMYAKIESAYQQQTYQVLRQQSVEELQARIHQIFDTLWDTNAMVFFSHFLDRPMCEEVLQEQGISIDLNAIWEKGTTSTTPSFEAVDQAAILKQLIAGLSADDLIEYAQYTTCSFVRAASLEETRPHVRSVLEMSAEEVVHALHDYDEEWRIKREAFESWRRTRSADEARLLTYLQTIIYLRDARKHVIRQGQTSIWRIGEILFERFHLNPEVLSLVTREEITGDLQALATRSDELQNRLNGFLLFISESGEKLSACVPNVREIQQALEDAHFGKPTSGPRIIHGQSASAGVATGTARVILHLQDFASFQNGEILVTGMTRPEFVPLMKKASAIVTDEGGITCHAAIVSRELGIPCVIGTKVATRHIPNGARITVDGEAGTIAVA